MRATKKISMNSVRALEVGETIWDSAVAGFGARRQRSEAVTYVFRYRRGDGKERWATIGRHGSPWTPDMARDEAKRLNGVIVDGADPSADRAAGKRANTVSELCDAYLADMRSGRLLTRRRAPKSPATIETDAGRIERHIKPLMGAMRVAAVTRRDVEAFMHAVARGDTAGKVKTAKPRGVANVRGGKGTATRTVGLLGGIFEHAIRSEMRTDNPVRGVIRYADGQRKRRLAPAEYASIGRALHEANIWPPAVAAIRFLLLTGWRLGDVISLTWSKLDLDRRTAFLTDTKTGESTRPLAVAAIAVLPERGAASDLVFPGSRGGEGARLTGLPKFLKAICAKGGLPADITAHTFRHSFASLASDLGYSEATVANLIGHKGHSTTSRYIHAADEVLLAAADRVAAETKALYLLHI